MRITSIVLILFFQLSLAAEELKLSWVLQAVVTTHPKLAEAQANIDVEKGHEISAGKAFEPMVKADSLGLPAGFYQYHRLATWVEQTLPVGGVSVAAGYRRSDGTIPPYYQEYATRSGGELFAKIAVPILAGSRIDKDRAEIYKARLAVEVNTQELAFTWLEIARDTTVAYWNWVAAGQRLRVLKSLLTIAVQRGEQIATQVENGALARVVMVENKALLLARRTAVLEAEEKFVSAQNQLSLFYRDINNFPVLAGYEHVPQGIAGIPMDDAEIEKWAGEVIKCRPDLLALDVAERQIMVDLNLAHNSMLPKLDLSTYVARDIGSGKQSLGQADLGIGVSFSLPLYRLEGGGGKRAAHARLSAVAAKRRALRDKIDADLRKLIGRVQLSRQRLELASERLTITERLADAERQRLNEGASELLTVNIRELAVAAAMKDAIDASMDMQTALGELLFIRGLAPAVE